MCQPSSPPNADGWMLLTIDQADDEREVSALGIHYFHKKSWKNLITFPQKKFMLQQLDSYARRVLLFEAIVIAPRKLLRAEERKKTRN